MIRAWRCWRVLTHNSTPQLWSVYMQCPWVGPRLTADCPPTIWHGDAHGIWAFKKWQSEFHNQIAETLSELTYVGITSGWVQLWGKIVEHEDGYRAEHALIESLDQKVWDGETLAVLALLPALQRHYGVELL